MNGNKTDYGFWNTFWGWLVLVVIIIGVGWFYVRPRVGSIPGEVEGETTQVAELIDKPDVYQGTRVVVTGSLREVIDNHSMIMASGAFSGDELRVVSRVPIEKDSDINISLIGSDTVKVEGEIREFDEREIEREFGVRLDDRIDAWEGETVLVADRVEDLD